MVERSAGMPEEVALPPLTSDCDHWAGTVEAGGVLSVEQPPVVPSVPEFIKVVTVVYPVVEPSPPPVDADVVPVAWRLWQRRDYWRDTLKASSFVLSILQDGYRLPFVKPLPSVWRRNSRMCDKYGDFVEQSIQELLRQGCMVEVSEQPWVVCSLSVDDSRDDLRLICNARPTNGSLWVEHFKYENINTARDILQRFGFLFQFDVKSAYPHIRLHRDGWGCFGVWWRGKFYVYTVLPFGLSTAPFVFSKVMKVLINHWRQLGIRVMSFLDDGLGGAASYGLAVAHSTVVRETMAAAGMTAHPTKSSWDPHPSTQAFLGFTLDLSSGLLGIKLDRVIKIVKCLVQLRRDVCPTPRQLSSLAGRIISLSQVIGNVVRVMTRDLYVMIYTPGSDWDSPVPWLARAWQEVQFWRQFAIEGGFQRRVQFWPDPVVVDVEFASDASATGLGVVQFQRDVVIAETFQPLSLEERGLASAWRELAAVKLGLQSFVDVLRGRAARWLTDSTAAVAILEHGSRSRQCHVLAREIFLFCLAHGIRLFPVWIPRALNTEADRRSREVDMNDWGLTSLAFKRLQERWGVPVVDLFADSLNARVTSFMSFRPQPGALAIDALASVWPKGLLYACPPWALLGRLIRRMQSAPCEVVLIIPVWPQQPWWPLLFEDGHHSALQLVDWLPLTREHFEVRWGKPGFLIQDHWRFTALAVRWSAVPAERPSFCLARHLHSHCPVCD